MSVLRIPPTSLCRQNRFPYGRVSRGDAQKNQFWSGHGMISRGTEYNEIHFYT